MRILSGIQPSGKLHIGNYFGMMRPALELAQKGEAFYFIAKSGDANGATTMIAPTVPLTTTTAPNPLSTAIPWKYGIESNANQAYAGPPYQLAPRGAIACDPTLPQTPHVGGMLAGLGDGSVRTVAPTISQWTFAAACTPAGQETLASDW